MAVVSFNELKIALETAQTKWLQGDLLAAYDQLVAILVGRLSSPETWDADVKVMQSLAELAGILGVFQPADDLLQAAIGLYEQADYMHLADYARLRRIQLFLERGELYRVRDLFRSMTARIGDIYAIEISLAGLEQWEKNCHWEKATEPERLILFAEAYLAMGRLLSALGQYSNAMLMLDRGLEIAQAETATSLAQQTIAPLKSAKAAAYLEQGELALAQSYLEMLVPDSSYPEAIIYHQELKGKLYLLKGEFGNAIAQFKQVLTRCREIRAQQAILRSTLNLAHVLILLNQTRTAQQYLIEAEVDALAIEETGLAAQARLLLQLAKARGQSLATGCPVGISLSGMRQESLMKPTVQEPTVKQLEIPQSSNYLTWFESRSLMFQWQLSRFNLDHAEQLLVLIQRAFQHTDSSLIQSRIRVLEAMLTYYQGIEFEERHPSSPPPRCIQQAAAILEEVRPILTEKKLKPELWQVQQLLGWCQTRLKVEPGERDKLTADTDRLLEELTNSLSPEEQTMYRLNKWTAEEEYIATQINQLQALQASLDKSFWGVRWIKRVQLMRWLNALLNHLDRYKNALAKQVIQSDPAAAPLFPPSSLWHRLLAHPRRRITLSFLVLPDRILVVRSGRLLLDFWLVPTTRLALRTQVQQWYRHAKQIQPRRSIGDVPEDEEIEFSEHITTLSEQVAELLNLPAILETLPKQTQALTIVPDDILHGFPFAAIRYQEQYLIERFALCINYESQLRKPFPRPTMDKNRALVVGVSKGNSQFSPLPGVLRELQQIQQGLAKRKITTIPLVDEEVNKTAIENYLSRSTLFHVACHGVFALDSPDQSGLVLINGEGQEILSLREFSRMDLTHLLHATLSSCWSADHFILPGRWIISLPETLWRSGTESVLGSLWEVYDNVAIAFMTRFYYYLSQYPRDRALQKVQLECLQGSLSGSFGVDTTAPTFWAGFNLYGDPFKLNL